MKLSPIDLANLARYRNLGLRALREIPIQNGNLEGDDLSDLLQGLAALAVAEGGPLQDQELFSPRTLMGICQDLQRLRARRLQPPHRRPAASRKLHLGCGQRKLPGWLNVDVYDSDQDLDLTTGLLPWPDDSFDLVVSQHMIEHLDMEREAVPLLAELRRVCAPGAKIWITCPDMAKICRSYVEDRGRSLLEARLKRWPDYRQLYPQSIPPQDIVNNLFHQWGQHLNLFDQELLAWAAREAGLGNPQPVASEADLLAEVPDLPPRNDDEQTMIARIEVIK